MFQNFLLACGLASDACAVSIGSSLEKKQGNWQEGFRLALVFGLFQGFMPVLGWWLGTAFHGWIESVDHWIAFVLLSWIGGKMILDSSKTESEDVAASDDWLRIIVLAVATSLDAMAVGLSFSFLGQSILIPALVIGLVTFVLSFGGFVLAGRVGAAAEGKVALVGGVILIGIGLKILLQHLGFLSF
ncbi:MAG: manganese efflux pump MntP family protein [Patescibacteria group bacterium]